MDPWKFILVTDRRGRTVQSYVSFVQECAKAGVTSVQLREKGASNALLMEFGTQLLEVLTPLGIPLVVNDHIALAQQLNAGGVHLGQTDDWSQIDTIREGIVGLSIDTIDEVDHANLFSCHYIAASGVFPTPSKNNLTTIWGTYGLEAICQRSRHPVVAIGGINLKTIDYVKDSGIAGVAVIGAVHDTDDPCTVIETIRNKLC